jgi:hypothetical protein
LGACGTDAGNEERDGEQRAVRSGHLSSGTRLSSDRNSRVRSGATVLGSSSKRTTAAEYADGASRRALSTLDLEKARRIPRRREAPSAAPGVPSMTLDLEVQVLWGVDRSDPS